MPQLRHSMSVSALSNISDDVNSSPWKSPESLVVRVVLEISESHYSNLYKSILVSGFRRDALLYVIALDRNKLYIVVNVTGYVHVRRIVQCL